VNRFNASPLGARFGGLLLFVFTLGPFVVCAQDAARGQWASAAQPGTGADAPRATPVGEVAFVFTDRETADVTFVLEGIRVTHKIGRVTHPR
jgi:hypothetical protein